MYITQGHIKDRYNHTIGLYEFLRMSFTLKNAAQTFQWLMDIVCSSLDAVFVYMVDILYSGLPGGGITQGTPQSIV